MLYYAIPFLKCSCYDVYSLLNNLPCVLCILCFQNKLPTYLPTIPGHTTLGIAHRISPAQLLAISEEATTYKPQDSNTRPSYTPFEPVVTNPELSHLEKNRMESFLKRHTLRNDGLVFQLGPLTSKSTLARSNKPTSIPPRSGDNSSHTTQNL